MIKGVVVIMGPTGSGKTKLALSLAEHFRCEIISADSMQVYREMDIGTAKAKRDERRFVPHHMIDILDITERLDIYFYTERAREAIVDIQSRNKIPVIVGGSGLYIKSVLYGLDPLPSNFELRNMLFGKYEKNVPELKDVVSREDPKAFILFENQPRKLIRALEVLRLTGRSIVEQQLEWNREELKLENVLAYNVRMERSLLFERIAQRTDKMLADGWIDEARYLVDRGLLETPTARQAIGYPIIAEYLRGRMKYDEMKLRIISATKKYARRQETWFKHQHPESLELLLENIDSLKFSEGIARKLNI